MKISNCEQQPQLSFIPNISSKDQRLNHKQYIICESILVLISSLNVFASLWFAISLLCCEIKQASNAKKLQVWIRVSSCHKNPHKTEENSSNHFWGDVSGFRGLLLLKFTIHKWHTSQWLWSRSRSQWSDFNVQIIPPPPQEVQDFKIGWENQDYCFLRYRRYSANRIYLQRPNWTKHVDYNR